MEWRPICTLLVQEFNALERKLRAVSLSDPAHWWFFLHSVPENTLNLGPRTWDVHESQSQQTPLLADLTKTLTSPDTVLGIPLIAGGYIMRPVSCTHVTASSRIKETFSFQVKLQHLVWKIGSMGVPLEGEYDWQGGVWLTSQPSISDIHYMLHSFGADLRSPR